MNKKVWLCLLYGGCFFLFCMMLYFCITSAKYFIELSASRERKRQTLHFSKEENQYSAIIPVYSNDVYYLNWYPKMVLNTEINNISKRNNGFSQEGTDVAMSGAGRLSQQYHLRKANNENLSHSQTKKNLEEKAGKCIFVNSKGIVKIKELHNLKNFTFTLGPMTEGNNIIKIYFPPDYDMISDLTCDVIFSETSNIATPWIWLVKAILSALLLIVLIFILIRG